MSKDLPLLATAEQLPRMFGCSAEIISAAVDSLTPAGAYREPGRKPVALYSVDDFARAIGKPLNRGP